MNKKTKHSLPFLLVLILLLGLTQFGVTGQAKQTDKGCNIAIALDVSGSMVATDENRLSIEMIEMIIDMCHSTDSVTVIAYNDYIVYQSPLLSMAEETNRQQLKADLAQLAFQGETDNGLGLKTAVDTLLGGEADKDAYVLLISDGKTDLANSQSERTVEQSDQDWETSSENALEKGIRIHTISFVNAFSEDTNQMTIASTKTGGTSNVVASPLQFMKAVTQICLSYQSDEEITIQTADAASQIGKLELDLADTKTDEVTLLTVATQDFSDFEMIAENNEIELYKNRHYAVVKIKNPVKEKIYAMYSCAENGNLLWSIADTGVMAAEPTEKETQTPAVEEKKPSAPKSEGDLEEELLLSKGRQTFDVSALFTDADSDIVKYEISTEKGTAMEATLTGTMLEVLPKTYEDAVLVVTATDATNLRAQTEIRFHCIPLWKEYYNLIVVAIIVGILLLTALACFFLYRLFFCKKTVEKMPEFTGVLYAAFIDLKSKNDVPRLLFDLQEYPGEGVTLLELLTSIGIHEDLPDLDCFYFKAYKKNKIIFAHSSEGGVFIGEEPLERGKQTIIETGTTIYLSFAGNASEYELKYAAKGTP